MLVGGFGLVSPPAVQSWTVPSSKSSICPLATCASAGNAIPATATMPPTAAARAETLLDFSMNRLFLPHQSTHKPAFQKHLATATPPARQDPTHHVRDSLSTHMSN